MNKYLSGYRDKRKAEYFWGESVLGGRYSVRTPWLSILLAALGTTLVVPLFVYSVVQAISGDPGFFILATFTGVLIPLAVWGLALSIRYARGVRRVRREHGFDPR